MEYSFSIIIPVYNAERYIKEMLNSVLGQSYTNWNLLIIDDGSTDSSSEICDSYSADNVQILHFPNQGQIAARIEGIKRATGDYTLVLDADDILHTNCLKIINEIINRKQYDAVIFPYQMCDESLKPLGRVSDIPRNNDEMSKEETLEWVIKEWNHGLVNKAIRTDLIKKGITETITKKVKINGDYAMIVPIISQLDTIFSSSEVLYTYRVYQNSISHKYSFQHLIDTDYVSDFIAKYLDDKKLYTKEMSKLVNVAYLKMIVMILEGYYNTDAFDFKLIENFKKNDFYKTSIFYETIQNCGFGTWLELKALRNNIKLLTIILHIKSWIMKAKKTLKLLLKKEGN